MPKSAVTASASRIAGYIFPAILLAVILASAILVVAGVAPAEAQQRVERKSILEFFFGDRNEPPRRVEPERNSRPRATHRQAKPAPPQPPPEPEVAKLENARKILVIGDFLASGLAAGLSEAFEKSPGVVVIDRSNGSSGLVRDDFYDWPANAPAILQEVEPDIIVVQIGSNDSQEMSIDGQRAAVRSPQWLAEYEKRLDALISTLTQTPRPLIWVGLPSFNFTSLSADMAALNSIYKLQVERANGEFIDIWDGFVDEDGKFIFTGSDINGQQVRLRGPDGINMTPAGRRKMAFYVEKPLRRLLGGAAATDIATLGPMALGTGKLPDLNFPSSPLDAANPVRTRPIAMTDPYLDGGEALLGGTIERNNLTPTPRDLLVNKGIPPEAPEGRVDNFR